MTRSAGGAPAAFALAAAVFAAAPAAAWDNQGHMATGEIAYDLLARSRPEVVRAVVALMRAHPDRARFDRELGGAQGPARDRLLFSYMARWPDDVRRTPYDRPDWHYAVRIVSGPGAVLAFHNGRAGDAFPRQLAIARDPRAGAGERAVALCWVLHLVGDMHQPLHAGHWMSARFPLTDRAGSIAWVRAAPGAPPVELHLFWDRAGDQPGGDAAGAQALAALAEARTPAAAPPPLPASPRAAFEGWAASSRRLAHDVAYDGGRFEGGASPAQAVTLSPGYVARAKGLAVRRIGEAGARLAQLLSTPPSPEAEACTPLRPLLAAALLAGSGAAAAPAAKTAAAAPATPPAPFTAPVYVMGSAKAPVVVTEYLSAGCTHCAAFDMKEFPQIKARYIDTGKVRWEVRELLAGPVELAAAGFVLARCTGRERYWSTLEGVFRAQEGIFKTGDLRTGLLGVAHGAGLTDKQFDACMADDKAFAAADARSEESARAGVNMTPTFVMAGRKFDKVSITPADIDAALAAKR